MRRAIVWAACGLIGFYGYRIYSEVDEAIRCYRVGKAVRAAERDIADGKRTSLFAA